MLRITEITHISPNVLESDLVIRNLFKSQPQANQPRSFQVKIKTYEHLTMEEVWQAYPPLFMFNKALPVHQRDNEYTLEDMIVCLGGDFSCRPCTHELGAMNICRKCGALCD